MGIPSGFPILPVLGGSRCAKRPDLPRLRPETMGHGPGPGVLSGDRVLPGDLLFLLGLSFPALLAGHPVPCGANLAPGLPWDAGVFAVPALSALFGLLSPLPLVATAGSVVPSAASGAFTSYRVSPFHGSSATTAPCSARALWSRAC